MERSLAPATRTSYRRSVEKFRAFVEWMGVSDKDTFTAQTVEWWIAHLSLNNSSRGTIISHLSAIRHFCKAQGFHTSLESPKMKLMLRGLNRTGTTNKQPCLAVSCAELRKFCWHIGKLSVEGRRLVAMVTIAYYGFLRPSEYCLSPAGHSLRWKDVRFAKRGNAVQLRFDSFKHSRGPTCIVVRSMQGEPTCPVKALRDYRNSLGAVGTYQPLFDRQVADFRKEFAHACALTGLRAGLTPHSLRRGGVTWASRIGWSDARIRAHGRWHSDAFKKYTRSH